MLYLGGAATPRSVSGAATPPSVAYSVASNYEALGSSARTKGKQRQGDSDLLY
jgi:hypothetical protein